MRLTKLLIATCSVLALAGCGTPKSSTPAESTPAADATTDSAAKPATEVAPPASEGASEKAPAGDAVAPPETTTVQDAASSTPRPATATERLTDQEVKALLESIEKRRAAFEAALDEKLKNSTIKGERGEVKTNQFFDDLQDQVKRTRDRFSSDYSASSEVLSLLQLATRLNAWASTQPAGFRGSGEWDALATDFRHLAAVYNSALLRPRQQGLGAQARRINDAELVTVAASVEKNMDAFRSAYDSALTANTALTPASRKTAIQNVDAMKNSARALHAALEKKEKGVAEANALLRGSVVMADATLKLPSNSSAAAAWTPVREDLAKIVLAYEITPAR
jgi:hypothetical protein